MESGIFWGGGVACFKRKGGISRRGGDCTPFHTMSNFVGSKMVKPIIWVFDSDTFYLQLTWLQSNEFQISKFARA